MPRSALIVDDSRTALTALSRLLRAQGMSVDTAESGPEALDFLRGNAFPGVLFLDHMMPGMDGFETLGALKSDQRTAAIPVVMYTTQEGDAYMGQALALGAVGVLRKPVNPVELATILQRVDRLRGTSVAPIVGPERPRTAVTGVIDVPSEFRSPPPDRPVTPAPARAPAPPPVAAAQSGLGIRNSWALLAGLMLVPAAWYYLRYQQADHARLQLVGELAQLRSEQRAAEASAVAQATDRLRSSLDAREQADRREEGVLLEALAWAVNQRAQYAWNEEPLGDARLSLVRELVTRLAAAGFHGTVRLETHVGEFCLGRDAQGNFRLPNDNSAFALCEVVTYPPAQAVLLGQRQSPAFARYLAQQRGERIQVTVASFGNSRPLVPYPDLAGAPTAGDWNQAARLNQRVEVVLVPAS
jgi:CheY-like chemotaxis protein